MIRRIARAALLAMLATLLATTGAAAAATGFVADETLSSAATTTPVVAMAPNGYAIVGWVERTSGVPVVRASVRPPGGTWSPPETLPVGLESVFSVSVAIAASGAAAVTWEEVTSPSTFAVGVASRAAGGTFVGPEVLSGIRQTLDPSVGIAADGTVTLLYAVNPDTVLRDFPAGGSALAAPLQPLAANCSPGFAAGIAEAPSGDAVAPLYCGGASFALRRGGSWTVSPTVARQQPGRELLEHHVLQRCSGRDRRRRRAGRRAAADVHPAARIFGVCQTIATTVDATLMLPLGGLMTVVPGRPGGDRHDVRSASSSR